MSGPASADLWYGVEVQQALANYSYNICFQLKAQD